MTFLQCLRWFGGWYVCGKTPLACMATIAVFATGATLNAQSNEEITRLFQSIDWKTGPCTVDLGLVAEIDVPSGFRFTGRDGARKWAEVNGNVPDRECLGVLTPNGGGWYMAFAFSEIGYVKDDERDRLDADAILEAIKKATAEANRTRRMKGWPDLYVVGWELTPSYDEVTNNLVWAIRGRSANGELSGNNDMVNYNTRLLGRRGVMSANLVDSARTFGQNVPTVKGLLTGFRYKTGNRYAEWRSGDKVATYGLTGLIAGGGTAVAAKTGFLAKLGAFLAKGGKALIVAVVAFFAWLGRKFFVGAKQN